MLYFKTFEQFLNESINPKIQDLKSFLTTHWKKKKKELEEYDITDFKKQGELEQSFPERFKDVLNYYFYFSNKLGGKTRNFNLPGYYFYEYDSLIENTFLIHFTSKDNAYKIYNSQLFKYGISNAEEINKAHSKDEINKSKFGYCFAFYPNDIEYAFKSQTDYLFKNDISALGVMKKPIYGDYSVIFKVESCIRVYHPINKQYMCVFWGKDATNINLINQENNNWVIKDKNQKKVLIKSNSYKELINNYQQKYLELKKQLK